MCKNCRPGKAHGKRNILRSRPPPSPLPSSVHEALNAPPLPDIQGADSLGAVDLVRRKGKQIDAKIINIDRDLSEALDRVRMQDDPLGLRDTRDVGDGIDRSDLVV